MKNNSEYSWAARGEKYTQGKEIIDLSFQNEKEEADFLFLSA